MLEEHTGQKINFGSNGITLNIETPLPLDNDAEMTRKIPEVPIIRIR
jgi:hypothetical protein